MVSSDLKQLKDIFVTFFKIGLFTFGGGYAMLPLIEKETVEKRNGLTGRDSGCYCRIRIYSRCHSH